MQGRTQVGVALAVVLTGALATVATSPDRASGRSDVLVVAGPSPSARATATATAGPAAPARTPLAVPTVARPAAPRPAARVRRAPVVVRREAGATSVQVARPAGRQAPLVQRVDGSASPLPSPSRARPTTGNSRVVVGSDDYLFVAQDWTVACQYDGQAERAVAAVAEVTQALRDSGRPTVLAIGPNKSTVMTAAVPADGVPRGSAPTAAPPPTGTR